MRGGHLMLFGRDGRLLIERVRLAHHFWTRLRGLIGRDELAPDECLVLPNCNSVHTMFMSYPIDVAFVDDTGKVIATRSNLGPWRIAGPVRGAQSVVELSAASLDRLGIGKGYEFGNQW